MCQFGSSKLRVSSWGVVCVLNEVESDRLWGGGTCWESDLEESTDLKQQRLGGGRERANQGNRRIGMSFLFFSNIKKTGNVDK